MYTTDRQKQEGYIDIHTHILPGVDDGAASMEQSVRMACAAAMTLYFSGLVYRDSCYKCDFSSSVRCSDITIGDFWQYNEAMRKKEPGGGMSLVLINTEKGMCVAERMSEEDVYMEECNVERLLATQKTFGATDKNTENIDIFREDYKNFGIEFVLKKYAGYNLKGRLKHILKKSLIVTGMMPIINSLSGK